MSGFDERRALHERAAAGTESVAWELDHQFRDRLCGMVDREMNEIYKRRQDPEDVVQSVFLSFYRRAANGEYRFEHTGALWNLLKRIARNKIIKRRDKDRAAKRDITREADVEEARLPAQPFTVAQAHLFGEALEAALKGMCSPAPEIFQLQLYGYTVAEVIEKVLGGLASPYPEILAKRLQGKSEREIAEEIGSTREAVRYKLNRIRERLSQMLGDVKNP